MAVALSIGVVLCSAAPAGAATSTDAPEDSSSRQAVQAFFAAAGPGFGTWDDRIGWQGGFVAPDGSIVYCIEPGIFNPVGDSVDGGWQDGVISRSGAAGSRQITPNEAARIGRIVAEFGQTWDNREASAVSFAVKAIANPDGMYASHSYTGAHNLRDYVNWVLFDQVGTAEAHAIADRAQAILDATAGTTAGPMVSSGTVNFTVDPLNNYAGTASVSVPGNPAGATATITLTNGVFELSGTSTISGATLGTEYAVHGVAPDDATDYKISGTAQINSGYSGQLHVWVTGDKQKTAGPGTASSFTAYGEDPTLRPLDFQPEAVSNTPRFKKPGEPLGDTATFLLAADEDGRVNEWLRNSRGEYAPTEWTVEAYAVSTVPEAPVKDVPAGAELIASTTVNTGTAGPEAAVEATFGDAVMPADGRAVVYVWKFDADAQPDRFRSVFPEGYLWTDLFGLADETAFGVDVTTKAQPGAKKGATSTDTAIVTGAVPNEGLQLTFEKFYVPLVQDATGTWGPNAPAGTEPGDLSWVCTADNLVADTLDDPQSVTAAGEYTSPAFPTDKHGIELWVEQLTTVPTDDAPSEVIDRGECGEKSEVTYVVDVKTQAFSDSGPGTAKRGDQLWDTAELTGWVPEGATVTFERYTVPANNKLVCTAETLDWTSPAAVTTAGLYLEGTPLKVDSTKHPAPTAKGGAVTTFVEVTRDVDGRVISRGECGEPSETVTTPAAAGNLAQTGGDVNPAWLGAGGLLLAGGLTAVLLPTLRRRRAAETVDAPAVD